MFEENLKGDGFGGLIPARPDFSNAQAVIIPVPYDGTACYEPGARRGPKAIVEASSQVEFYDAQWEVDCEQLKLALLNEVEPDMSGPGAMLKKVEDVYAAAVEKIPFALMLGGEHSMTTAAIRVCAKKYEGSLTVVQFDAHADLRDSYQGTPYSHASVMSRVIELAPIVQIGVRNASKEETRFIKKSGHPIYYSWDIKNKLGWVDEMTEGLNENVYITVDLDVFDPSLVPGVGTPEPGGLMWPDVVEAIRKIGERRNIVGADVMELSPIPGSVQSDYIAACLCFKLLAAKFLLK